MPIRTVGRDAATGRFMSVARAKARPETSVVETIHVSVTGLRRLERRRSARHLASAMEQKNR